MDRARHIVATRLYRIYAFLANLRPGRSDVYPKLRISVHCARNVASKLKYKVQLALGNKTWWTKARKEVFTEKVETFEVSKWKEALLSLKLLQVNKVRNSIVGLTNIDIAEALTLNLHHPVRRMYVLELPSGTGRDSQATAAVYVSIEMIEEAPTAGKEKASKKKTAKKVRDAEKAEGDSGSVAVREKEEITGDIKMEPKDATVTKTTEEEKESGAVEKAEGNSVAVSEKEEIDDIKKEPKDATMTKTSEDEESGAVEKAEGDNVAVSEKEEIAGDVGKEPKDATMTKTTEDEKNSGAVDTPFIDGHVQSRESESDSGAIEFIDKFQKLLEEFNTELRARDSAQDTIDHLLLKLGSGNDFQVHVGRGSFG